MKVFQTTDRLVVKENPGCLWILGLFFASFGILFIYGAYNGFVLFGMYSPWTVGLTFAMGLVGLAIGFWSIHKTPINNLEIDRNKRTATIIKWGVFGKRSTVYHFDEIKRFCLIEGQTRNGRNIWEFGLELTNGERVPITSLGSHAEDHESKYVFPINIFIGKELPVCQLNSESKDESSDEMS